MFRQNWFQLFENQIKEINNTPRLLLHACCAPCSSYVIQSLSKYFKITIYYYNPNIHPEAEYKRRLNELETFLEKYPFARGINLVKELYDPDDYFNAVKTKEEPELEKEAERGERCRRCYQFRMKKSAEYAEANGYDFFTTTLSISPYKDADKINEVGIQLEKEFAIKNNSENKTLKYLFADFKKRDGFKKSLELSNEYGLYRQDYCGCIYSKKNCINSKSGDTVFSV